MIEYVKLKKQLLFHHMEILLLWGFGPNLWNRSGFVNEKECCQKIFLKCIDIKHMHHFYTKTSRKSIQTFIYPASYLERINKCSTNTNNKQLALSGPKPEEITNCLPVWAPKKVLKKVHNFLISSLLLKLFVVNGKGKINSEVETFKWVIFRGLPMVKN